MSYKIEFIFDAAKDYRELDGSIKKLVNKKIDQLTENPLLGQELGNKFNINLSGFFKIYIVRKKNRIVYRLITPTEIEIIEIRGIGKRDKEEIYRIISKRSSNINKER